MRLGAEEKLESSEEEEAAASLFRAWNVPQKAFATCVAVSGEKVEASAGAGAGASSILGLPQAR